MVAQEVGMPEKTFRFLSQMCVCQFTRMHAGMSLSLHVDAREQP